MDVTVPRSASDSTPDAGPEPDLTPRTLGEPAAPRRSRAQAGRLRPARPHRSPRSASSSSRDSTTPRSSTATRTRPSRRRRARHHRFRLQGTVEDDVTKVGNEVDFTIAFNGATVPVHHTAATRPSCSRPASRSCSKATGTRAARSSTATASSSSTRPTYKEQNPNRVPTPNAPVGLHERCPRLRGGHPRLRRVARSASSTLGVGLSRRRPKLLVAGRAHTCWMVAVGALVACSLHGAGADHPRLRRSRSWPTTAAGTRRSRTTWPRCGPRSRARSSCGRPSWRATLVRDLAQVPQPLPRPARRVGDAHDVRRRACSSSAHAAELGPADPFKAAFVIPPGFDGPGPNPLLQNHILMAIHPPMLYLGYVGFTVPFAFAIAALVTGRLGEGWLLETRRWTLFAWGFLTVGIVARRVVELRGARLGRLLGVGPGRERLVPAVADRHRVPALGDGAGTPRHAARVEPGAAVRHVRAHDPRHLPHPIGRPRLGARVHRVRHRHLDPDRSSRPSCS